jgi:CRISPR type III-A-associated protein Csm2
MSDEVQPVVENIETPKPEETPKPAEAVPVETAKPEPTTLEAKLEKAKQEAAAKPAHQPSQQPRPQGDRPQGERGPRPEKGRDDKPRGDRGPGGGDRGNRPQGDRSPRPEGAPRGDNRGGERGGDRREGGRPNFGAGGRPFDGPVDIELEKLISDSLYLDNQAHVVVMRMRDMDSGTKSQLRRLYNAVRRAVRAPESERQHQFVMLRARLAYTIARHSLRSLDALERLLLQVTRKNDARGYERFKDLFEAIVAYNE